MRQINDWESQANCNPNVAELGWQEGLSDQKIFAGAVCGTCPVQRECLANALTDFEPGDEMGVRGGVPERQIREVAKRLGKSEMPDATPAVQTKAGWMTLRAIARLDLVPTSQQMDQLYPVQKPRVKHAPIRLGTITMIQIAQHRQEALAKQTPEQTLENPAA